MIKMSLASVYIRIVIKQWKRYDILLYLVFIDYFCVFLNCLHLEAGGKPTASDVLEEESERWERDIFSEILWR